MMTTMCAIVAGLPLALGQGAGSELRRPLGIAIVGGLLVSQLADALHDAGDLSLSRPREQSARRPAIDRRTPQSANESPQPV